MREINLETKVLYVDMDGTMAEWQKVAIEVVTSKGYFENLPTVETIIKAVRKLVNETNIKVRILTSVFNDDHSKTEKRNWVQKYIPELVGNIIFVPYGEDKNDYVKVSNKSFLLDDFSDNLHAWENAGGKGIKCYNGINGTKGTWKGYSVNANTSENVVYDTLLGIMLVA